MFIWHLEIFHVNAAHYGVKSVNMSYMSAPVPRSGDPRDCPEVGPTKLHKMPNSISDGLEYYAVSP